MLKTAVLIVLAVGAIATCTACGGERRGALQFDALSIQYSGPCFGPCPEYFVTVLGDGRVQYLGVANVRRQGVAESRLTPLQVQALGEALQDLRFLSLRERYFDRSDGCPAVLDEATSIVTLTVRTAASEKRVLHSLSCGAAVKPSEYPFPLPLTALEGRIDAITGVSAWTGVPVTHVPVSMLFPGRSAW